ncbi:MAG TPA: hypothetical protein VLF20_06180 [Patescibacteria group bacterium]|nr:hypothetical protein [Patescibacteria group bacterium]
MNKQTISLIVFFFIVVAIFVLRPLGQGLANTLLEQAFYIIASVIAAMSAFLAFRTYGRGPRFVSLLALSLGLFSWVIADVLFTYLEYILNDLPYPSIADYFFLAGYILMLTGIIREVLLSDVSWKKMNKKVYLVCGTFSVLMITAFTYLTIFTAYNPEASFAENFVTIGYTVGDLLLSIAGFFLLIMTWEYRGGKASKVWIGIFLGYSGTLVGDLLYSIFPEQLFSHTGPIFIFSQFCYIGGYLFLAYGFLQLRSILLAFQKKPLH